MKPSNPEHAKPYIVGLTGGIGSGKSTVAEIIREAGIPVIDADAISRAALDPGTDCYEMTKRLFGPECLLADGRMDRKWIARRIFSDPVMRDSLNAIIHPYVLSCMQKETESIRALISVWEVPLLFESGYDRFCSRTVAVLCEEALRVRRIVQRDGMSEEEAISRIRTQMTDEQRKTLADDFLYNEGDMASLYEETQKLIRVWRKLI